MTTVAVLGAARVFGNPAPKVLVVNSGSYSHQGIGSPAAIQSLSAALHKHADTDVFKISWHVASGVDIGRPETRQVVYDRRHNSLECQLRPDYMDKWWGWIDVNEKAIHMVAQKSGNFKDLESYGCKSIPYAGPIH